MVLGVAVLAASLPLALVAVANGPPMALVLVGILGLGTVVTDVLALTTLQRLIPSDRLARVFGILDSLLVGANVLGAAVSAWLVGVVGIRATLVAIGVAPAIAVVGVAGLARRRVEPGAVDLTVLRPAVDLLAGLPMLRTASITSIEALAAAATERSMPPGTEAIRQGDAPDDFYAIVRGRFDVLVTSSDGATRRVRSLGEGDGFGEIGLLHGVPRTATVVATTEARVLQVPGSAFLRAVGGGTVTGGTGPAAGAIDYFTAG